MGTPLIALASNNAAVRETVTLALRDHYQRKGGSDTVNIVAEPRKYSDCDGFEALVEQARQSAEAARSKHNAYIGIAGASGLVAVRKSKSRIAQWRTFAVVATCKESVVATALGEGTYPEQLEDLVAEAMGAVAGKYAEGRPEPDEEVAELAGIAISGWISLKFEPLELKELWLM